LNVVALAITLNLFLKLVIMYPTLYFPSNAHNVKKNVEVLKHFKIRKLLQHVSFYKGTIIREPQPVLS